MSVRGAASVVLAAIACALLPLSALAQGIAGPTLTLEELRARYGDAASRYVTLGGVELHYKDEGSGPALLMVHGSNGSLEGFDALAADLAKDYRVVRLDIPAMGLSGTVAEDVPTDKPYVDDLMLALLDHLGIEKAALVGTSFGGTASYYFAARFPDRARALILANTPADPIDQSSIPRDPELQTAMDRTRAQGFRDRAYWEVYLNGLQGPGVRLPAETIDRYYDMNRRLYPPRQRWHVRMTSSFPEPYAMLAQVRAPTLLVWGAHDYVLPLAKHDRLRSLLPAAQVSSVILDDVGHYPPFEVPERFAKIVRAYLQTVVEPAETKP